MSSEEHLLLSSFIKKIHKELRQNSEEQGVDKAWREHCKNKDTLKEYAKCMKLLATEHWDKKHENDIKHSRNAWILHHINQYFTDEVLLKKRQKEFTEKEKNNLTFPIKTTEFQKPYQLLDVGSCYNPFKNIENLSTTAIDICPASSDVYKCDFINMKIVEIEQKNNDTNTCEKIDNNYLGSDKHESIVKNKEKELHDANNRDEFQLHDPSLPQHEDEKEYDQTNCIESMRKETYDIVIFSLLLEYIPCSKLRFHCCVKAYHLLKHEGILIIVTPDSKHETSNNVQIMKQWKFSLAVVGFKRIKYEKLKHLHCMVFRKSCFVHNFDLSFPTGDLFIPQDMTVGSSMGSKSMKEQCL